MAWMWGAMASPSDLGCITLTTALFDLIGSHFKDVPRSFHDADGFQARPFPAEGEAPVPLQSTADLNRDILGSRHDATKGIYIFVQIAVLKGRQHLLPHHLVQGECIHRLPGSLLQRTAHAHFDCVIVAMSIGVVAFSVDAV